MPKEFSLFDLLYNSPTIAKVEDDPKLSPASQQTYGLTDLLRDYQLSKCRSPILILQIWDNNGIILTRLSCYLPNRNHHTA